MTPEPHNNASVEPGLTVRPISAPELDSFAAPHRAEWTKEILNRFWREGRSSPGQCFVAEDARGLSGRVAYWSNDRDPNALLIFGLCLPWQADYLDVGRKLLLISLGQMKTRGATSVTHYFYAEFDGNTKERHRLMQELGFKQYQDKLRYLWTVTYLSARTDRLNFRTVLEAGEEAFLDALRRVTEDTLDREDWARVEELGAEAAAREYLRLLDDADNPTRDWWLLGYEPDGTLAGLVVPQPLDNEEGTIGYIGVVPEKRGRGYGTDLLIKATRTIKERGLVRSVAEVDRLNRPMRTVLEQAGYQETGPFWAYRFELTDLPDKRPRVH